MTMKRLSPESTILKPAIVQPLSLRLKKIHFLPSLKKYLLTSLVNTLYGFTLPTPPLSSRMSEYATEVCRMMLAL